MKIKLIKLTIKLKVYWMMVNVMISKWREADVNSAARDQQNGLQ